MTLFSYHVSQEQFSPRELLELVERAEAAGFDAAFSSDHFQPWARAQGHSGFVWSWLGAALQSTRRLSFATITVPLGWRYQPVVLAQAIATLGEMFPGRLPWIAVGSGEAVNECAMGAPWPGKDERNARLREGTAIMRALLAGETVTHRGLVTASHARLWSRPEVATSLIGAAVSAQTAGWLGEWADGLLTTAPDVAALRAIVAAFQRHGAGKPMHLKLQVAWGRTQREALSEAHEQWRFSALGGGALCDLHEPENFEDAARFVRPEDMHGAVFVSADLAAHVARLRECSALGFASIDIHNVGTNQAAFIDAFGEHVLPKLR
jgi:coenzyme F420-dependent glucose-6-phosphate dehydrogenase